MTDLPLASQFNDTTVTEGQYKIAFTKLLTAIGEMKLSTDAIASNTLAAAVLYDAVQNASQATLNANFVAALAARYSKTEADAAFAPKATTYSKSEVDASFLNVYPRTDVDTAMALKADRTDLTALSNTVDTIQHPAASVTPATTGQLSFELTSDTRLTVKVKGSDGVVRSAILNLA